MRKLKYWEEAKALLIDKVECPYCHNWVSFRNEFGWPHWNQDIYKGVQVCITCFKLHYEMEQHRYHDIKY